MLLRNKTHHHSVLKTIVATFVTFSMTSSALANDAIPAEVFDLGNWKITLPMDANNDGNVDEVPVAELQSYVHPDYFHLDDDSNLVFVTPNSAFTTPNSSNSRTELRQMLRGENDSIGTKDPANNFSLASHPEAESFAQIGGYLEATLRVEHVAERTENPERQSAYSVVVGQIHALKDEDAIQSGSGFGHGNEPLKIYYKKLPNQATGSVFWNYERNLAKEDADRTDISHAVWGNDWSNNTNPNEEGIALGESFSYRVEIKGDIMHLTFLSDGHPTRTFEQNLADNVNSNGNADTKDNPEGYAGEGMYFKAGSYNQCNTRPDSGACAGTGNWETDLANGDYTKVVFSTLESGSIQ
ncbi:polysaccharide lyase family 7 protein [Vreelandella sp. F11]|uniref:polysaccharide lyase family 7 protein n=1 Tax=Vreelandella sp. F11 TaxID=3394751 RepID=UPI0036DDECF9